MTEITSKNFKTQYSNIENVLCECRFIAIDAEFSALSISNKNSISLFDDIPERYQNIRKTCEQMIPVQIGLTAFTFDRNECSYTADIFSFYLFPRTFSTLDKRFLCQASALQFLCHNNFDFNKFIYEGIPFINRSQEAEIIQNLDVMNNALTVNSSQSYEIENILDKQGQIITKWIYTANDGDIKTLSDLDIYWNNPDVMYQLHKNLRNRFKDILWTYQENGQFKVRKVTKEEFNSLINEFDLTKSVLLDILGFTRLFRLLVSLRKPIIGHNLLTDLMLMVHHFDNPLSKSYTEFKDRINELFPSVYDTKCLSFHILRHHIPEPKRWQQNTLSHLYNYFKGGPGRHLSNNSPLIQPRTVLDNYDQFHHAGWDSYCTGYIFIRMAHVYACNKFKHSRKFMSNELFAAVSEFKNKVNLIRASVSYIQLDGEDPKSSRPPYLIVETRRNKPLNISQVTSLLGSYGFVEVKPYSYGNTCRRAIVAVDNFGSAKRILKNFQTHADLRISQYNVFQHSPFVKAAIWSSIIFTGALIAWITNSKIRK